MTKLYDDIGQNYAGQRQPDHRIAAAIGKTLTGCESVLNVGAGSGSYEPRLPTVVAVEPSRTMIEQRPVDAAPVIQARAEALPFRDASFDAVLAILTVHHWSDQAKGLAECWRVARSRLVLLTMDFEACAKFWLFEYFPELFRIDRNIFPPISRYAEAFDVVEMVPVPIPADCRDGFLGAYWQRPRAYLNPAVRKSISTFSKISDVGPQLQMLTTDIDTGVWEQRHGTLRKLEFLDLGYRLVIARKPTSQAPHSTTTPDSIFQTTSVTSG
jgi:SAM-dependent methyltransferase